VRVQGGATLGDVDREAQLFGLAVPAGVVSTTGVAGLTLHGGAGHLRRKHGLTIDSLVSVDIVTADGQIRMASATENEDLFWAVRGAGSNFGVVTSFEFRSRWGRWSWWARSSIRSLMHKGSWGRGPITWRARPRS
jgi:FAD/FMN-containing dehydrogenase